MPLRALSVRNFRIYDHIEISPDPQVNLITGGNASGKTTLLEAIHVLGSGRSFRTQQTDHLVRHGRHEWLLSAQVDGREETPAVNLAIGVGQEGRRIVVGPDHQAKLADLAQHLPLLVISPDSHFDFHQHTKTRRAVLDWLLFHVEPSYHQTWGRYQRALQQRNAALKDPKQSRTRLSWDEELVSHGQDIQSRRQGILDELQDGFQAIAAELVGMRLDFSLYLVAGWNSELGMSHCLEEDRARDLARGFTHSGPHRNDLEIRISGQPSQEEASHGQNKLLVIALRLAQLLKLHEVTGKHCCLLVDDLPAELDAERRARLSRYFASLPAQVFVTATDHSLIDTTSWPSFRRFHVEQGGIKTL
jgi:DNA replication and repair protein RecF